MLSSLAPIIGFAAFYFCILVLGTISGIFSERAGIVNIAINGFIVFGAIMYCLASVIVTDFVLGKKGGSALWQIPLAIFATLTTGVFALLFGLGTIKLKSDQTITGFATGILATGIASILILILLGIQGQGTEITLRGRAELAWSEDTANLKNIVSFKTFATLGVVFAAWFALRKTKWGLRFRSVGENPQASDVAGINVNKIKWQAVVLAGMVAGLAGSFFAQSRVAEFSINKDVAGLGFLALAIMITSRWKVSNAIIMSAIFAFMLSFSFYGGGFIPIKYKHLLQAVPYAATLVVMVFTSRNTAGPAAAGVAYDKTKR
ncbi:ABC transporter permease [Mycoplasma nasistruthionis]|uniref:ABC transporter permease n=1 Tax=Mycoplasma nasistruthionis TaxID=353852 RepID=UPI0021CB1C9A|nr:ABC transporter permease [Mycoplasma nasistruthionis]